MYQVGKRWALPLGPCQFPIQRDRLATVQRHYPILDHRSRFLLLRLVSMYSYHKRFAIVSSGGYLVAGQMLPKNGLSLIDHYISIQEAQARAFRDTASSDHLSQRIPD